MTAYYNEFDPHAAAWLRELIKAGQIADGDVDERSIIEVTANDVKGYTQQHFFAGIGGWSLAARLAGWSDDKPLFTGSPPCQPFSTAGRQLGKEDARHLTPHWLELVRTVRPPFVAGEQVAAAINKDAWLDDLLDALEAENYATGAIVLPACSVGAPHIRQRIFFVGRLGDSEHAGLEGLTGYGDTGHEPGRFDTQPGRPVAEASATCGLADTEHDGCSSDEIGRGATEASERCEKRTHRSCESTRGCAADVPGDLHGRAGVNGVCGSGTTQTGWNNTDWLFCRDGKWRPVESGSQPLVNGLPRGMGYDGDPCEPGYANQTAEARVMRLKGYGNAIVPQVAAEVLKELLPASN